MCCGAHASAHCARAGGGTRVRFANGARQRPALLLLLLLLTATLAVLANLPGVHGVGQADDPHPNTPAGGATASHLKDAVSSAPPLSHQRVVDSLALQTAAAKNVASQTERAVEPVTERATERIPKRVGEEGLPPATAAKKVPTRVEGRTNAEHPEQLPGLTIHHRRYTPDELMALYGNFTVIYTFVNGSEANHYYRKRMIVDCAKAVVRREENWYDSAERYLRRPSASDIDGLTDPDGGPTNEHRERWLSEHCFPAYLRARRCRTTGDTWRLTQRFSRGTGDYRDREVDELRHSFRSVEQHMGWHQGRVVIVSPGHYPTWVDGAKNFLANRCGGAGVRAREAQGSYLRITVVHQDAILPYGIKLTRNSNTIEQRLWRVKNISAVHLYYNDDYFVNRDVSITDIFNEFGGPIIRTEGRIIGVGRRGGVTFGWRRGALNTHLFTIVEVNRAPQDHLPNSMVEMWRATRNITTSVFQSFSPPNNSRAIDTAMLYRAERLPGGVHRDVKNRRFVTHAPYVYCTNMFTFLETRYERELAYNSFHRRARHSQDFYLPFVYNAFAMERPWAASPKFLPYLLQKKAYDAGDAEAPKAAIELNNFDGCGPASYRSGLKDSECLFLKVTDMRGMNERGFRSVNRISPLYFNLNAGYKSAAAGNQIRKFIRRRYPTPIYLESGVAPVSDEDRALPEVYAALMRLPVIAVSSFAEGLCPMVRSLQFVLRDHTGAVVSAVARHGTGADADPTLSELRTVMVHRVRSAVPAVACAFNERVRGLRAAVPAAPTRADALGAAVLARIVDSALSELRANGTVVDAAVVPSVCGVGVGVGGGGDVRVRAIVLDGRAAVTDALSLRRAVTMPGQTLALEDFDVVPLEDGSGDAVLVLSRQRSDAKAVHWVDGAAESDLLLAYPIPYAPYENLRAPLAWSNDDD